MNSERWREMVKSAAGHQIREVGPVTTTVVSIDESAGRSGPVLLAFPPPWNDDSPYPALLLLAGFLKKHGIEVVQRDLNIDWEVDHVQVDYLRELTVRLQHELTRPDLEPERGQQIANALTMIPYLVEHISEATADLRRTDVSIQRRKRAGYLFEQALSICWSPYYPTYLWNNVYYARHDLTRLSSALEAARSRNDNPFMEWFEAQMVELLSSRRFRLVGISLTSEGQVVPTFTLAHVIKRIDPLMPIVVGGPLLPYIRAALLNTRQIFEWVDYFVVGDGETPLLGICQHLADGTQPKEVPNLIYFDRTVNDVMVTETLIGDVDQVAMPDITGLDLGRYPGPASIWIQTSRGCYWDRCAFCSLCLSMANTYRERDMGLVLDEIGQLTKIHGLSIIKFADECFSVDRLTKLVDGLEQRGLAGTFKYCVLLRFEKQFTRELLDRAYRSGLRYVAWGLESAHPETLRLMRKGIDLTAAERCLKNSHESGIWNCVFTMAEFPGAPEEDLEYTLAYVLRNQEYIDALDLGVFQLEVGSDVHRHPDKYHLLVHACPADYICPRRGYDDLRQKRTVPHNPVLSERSMELCEGPLYSEPTHLVAWSMCYLGLEYAMSRLDGGMEGKLTFRARIQEEARQRFIRESKSKRIAATVLSVPDHLQARSSDLPAGFGRRAAVYDDRTGVCLIMDLWRLRLFQQIGKGKPFTRLVDELVAQAGVVDRSPITAAVTSACQEWVITGHLEARQS